MPEVYRQPQFHNPFPQLSRVAVAPFFNLTSEPTLDGRKVAIAYYFELQAVPGYEVIDVGVVEKAMAATKNDLKSPEDARRLAQHLNADAIVIGAVTDYSPYYPPRLGLTVEWYAANPGFHPIPPGYGLPWGTPDEKDIPGPLVFEAEMALAKAQLKTQTPAQPVTPVPEPPQRGDPDASDPPLPNDSAHAPPSGGSKTDSHVKPVDYAAEVDANATAGKYPAVDPVLPENWPDPKGFIPPGPRPTPPPYRPSKGPVLRHVRVYSGNDAEFTTALSNYYELRDEARFGGWQGYLQRSDDFIRFCCHKHIAEMLSARGGAGESKVVWRWPNIR
ncbi:MAG: hypothetical protein IT426_14875 [Pirellulales bacterium]|nr:hypothetical protein [Pirellulales bacterium]